MSSSFGRVRWRRRGLGCIPLGQELEILSQPVLAFWAGHPSDALLVPFMDRPMQVHQQRFEISGPGLPGFFGQEGQVAEQMREASAMQTSILLITG